MSKMLIDLPQNLQATNSWLGLSAVILFAVAYILVVLEEKIELRKSKPVLLISGLIWSIVASIAKYQGIPTFTGVAVQKNILEYSELLLFLMVVMTYIHALEDRQVFTAIRIWLINRKFSLKKLFWITGVLAFCISPIADNLTTALLMSTIIIRLAPNNHRFIAYACINIVIAANSGGVFSPFGDLTTLMVWQNNKLAFLDFFQLFIPAVVSFVVPSICISCCIKDEILPPINEKVSLRPGAKIIGLLFLLTIFVALIGNHLLQLPPIIGMMFGFSLLAIFSFSLRKSVQSFDIFRCIQSIEWDTLLFFYGIIMCIGGLDAIGYLEKLSNLFYHTLGSNLNLMHQHTPANVLIGLLSALLDNIPLMFAVLTMDPPMVKGQWLLVTLTLGIGGSLLSIGSAAGVALMGQTKGIYNFITHLKWSWAILLGYITAILVHFWLNSSLF